MGCFGRDEATPSRSSDDVITLPGLLGLLQNATRLQFHCTPPTRPERSLWASPPRLGVGSRVLLHLAFEAKMISVQYVQSVCECARVRVERKEVQW